jgi:glycosyltransferase involved in cell wall biosynthesis
MADDPCRACLPDVGYRRSMLELTRRRLEALAGAHTVVLSGYMARELAAVGVPGALVIPPWVMPGPARSTAGSYFAMGGRLVAHKGIDLGWRAWVDAGRPAPLKVVGSGPLEDDLAGAELLGWLSLEELRSALREARALIFPSRWQEPFGILGVEALAEGTPVIVAETGGTADWTGEGCVRVAAGDRRGLAAAIRRLANDPGRALELGRAGQAAAARRFSRRRIEPMIEGLYARVGGMSRYTSSTGGTACVD